MLISKELVIFSMAVIVPFEEVALAKLVEAVPAVEHSVGGSGHGPAKDRSLRGGSLTKDSNNGHKYVETNPEGIFDWGQSKTGNILKDDSEKGAMDAGIKMMTETQLKEFEEEVLGYYDRPDQCIPVSKGGTIYGGVDLEERKKHGDRKSSPIVQVKSHEGDVVCGNHHAENCAGCPQGHGASWCNADCTWNDDAGTCEALPLKKCDANGDVTKTECSECSTEECTGSEDCEKMPLMPGASAELCRYVLEDDTRSASTTLNYYIPESVPKPAWFFQRVDILNASSATFYNTNGHKFGYAGFQVTSVDPYDGRILASIWDQGGCDQDVDPNCPAEHKTETVACGTGIKCTEFEGEGTGRKSIVYSDNLPLIDEPYSIMTHAKLIEPYRMRYSSFFYIPGSEKWDSSEVEGSDYTQTDPGWRFLSTMEVATDKNQQWWMSDLYSFLEQWTPSDGLDKRAALYGPGYVAGETSDFVQLTGAHFHHGTIENYKHVDAWSDVAGSIGMQMGVDVNKQAQEGQVFQFPDATIPNELKLFIPMQSCISDATTAAEIESCLGETAH